MIKVTLKNIEDYGLPLDSTSKILERGTSEEVLRRLEKKYRQKTNHICAKSKHFEYAIYADSSYNYIPIEDKQKWITNYEVYIRSSFKYKFWIAVYKFINIFEN